MKTIATIKDMFGDPILVRAGEVIPVTALTISEGGNEVNLSLSSKQVKFLRAALKAALETKTLREEKA